METGPSKNLSWKELACHDGSPYPMEWRADRAVILAQAFEALRAALGGFPLLIASAYRTPEWNRKIKGAEKSQHLFGRALDLMPIRGVTVDQLWEQAYALSTRDKVIRGLGRYDHWVHIDTRPTTRLYQWDSRTHGTSKERIL